MRRVLAGSGLDPEYEQGCPSSSRDLESKARRVETRAIASRANLDTSQGRVGARLERGSWAMKRVLAGSGLDPEYELRCPSGSRDLVLKARRVETQGIASRDNLDTPQARGRVGAG